MEYPKVWFIEFLELSPEGSRVYEDGTQVPTLVQDPEALSARLPNFVDCNPFGAFTVREVCLATGEMRCYGPQTFCEAFPAPAPAKRTRGRAKK